MKEITHRANLGGAVLVLIFTLLNLTEERIINSRFLQVSGQPEQLNDPQGVEQFRSILRETSRQYIDSSNQVQGHRFRLEVNQNAEMTSSERDAHKGFRLPQNHPLIVDPTQNLSVTLSSQAPDLAIRSPLLGGRSPIVGSLRRAAVSTAPPQSFTNIDWSNRVTAIRDQGLCSSCWAFTSVALTEEYKIRMFRSYTQLSPQELVDCAPSQSGCNGDVLESGLSYIIANGVTQDINYPFVAAKRPCRIKRSPKYRIGSFQELPFGNCNTMISYLKRQTLAVAVATNKDFDFYSSGVLNSCGTVVDHSVQLIGYYRSGSLGWYTIKNQWGTSWGQKGFARIDATVLGGNLCQICSYPVAAFY